MKAGASLDYETATSHQVNVTVTDAGGLTPHRDGQHRRHQPERGPDRHHRRRRLGARERRRRHRRRHARRHRPGCRLDLHLYADVRPVRQVRGGRQRGSRQGRRQPRLRDRHLAPGQRHRHRRRRPHPHRDGQHRRHQPERGPDRHHRRRRHGGRERRRRHRRRHARRHRSGCRLDLHLYADARTPPASSRWSATRFG